MLRAINNYGVEVKVVAWAMLNNQWEYYFTELPNQSEDPEDSIAFAYVEGFENEFGSVDMDEIKPHILSFVKAGQISTDPESDLYLAPPTGGRWMTPEEVAAAEEREAQALLECEETF